VHGTVTEDPWFWLRDRDDPEVVAYLEAENAYTAAVTEPDAELRERLFQEIKARIQEDDESVPSRKDGWWYSTRTREGAQYGIHLRRRDVDGRPGPDEAVLLDENQLAAGHEYFAVGSMAVSPSGRLLAYSTDTRADERYTMRVRDLDAGTDLPDEIPEVSYGAAWSKDEQYLFYTVPDDVWRPHEIRRHRMGTDAGEDVVVLAEADERFWLGLGTTRSEDWIVIGSEAKNTSEYWIVPTADPTAEPVLIEPRRDGIEYRITHQRGEDGGRFLVLTNDGAPNFRVMVAPVAAPGAANWTELVGEPDGGRIDDIDVFARQLVLSERCEAIPVLTVIDAATGERRRLEFDEETFEAGGDGNHEYDTDTYRFGYSSLVTPPSVYDEPLDGSGERVLLKRHPVLGGYDPAEYASARTWATSRDGTRVPVSLLWKRALVEPGVPAMCLLYGYGSYEITIPDSFSSLRLNLVDRGVVFAIAHIRGGGEMGRQWYEQGRLEHKRNTFADFVAAAEHLVAEGWTAPSKLAIRGGSAGGLLIGAVVNQRPDLFAAAVAEVPFVDNVNTMLDETIPLTVTEYDEWGDPRDPALFAAMAEYSPYENVAPQDYPAMLVTAGLNDPRVQYWEPAKWVARLRATKTDGNVLLLKTEMGAGHGGPSGRYDAWRDEAFVQAFLLRSLGVA
jgi:oligopeptidase B